MRTLRPQRPATLVALLLATTLPAGCVQESHRTLEAPTVASYKTGYTGPRYTLVVGKFQNRSQYLRGAFADSGDPLGTQAKTILKTHLQQTGRFVLVDRDNMEEIAREATIRGEKQQLSGAQVAVTGDVTEFGRRETGDAQLFGILGYGKKQLAYAKVALNIVDLNTSRVVYAVQGAGEFDLSNLSSTLSIATCVEAHNNTRCPFSTSCWTISQMAVVLPDPGGP